MSYSRIWRRLGLLTLNRHWGRSKLMKRWQCFTAGGLAACPLLGYPFPIFFLYDSWVIHGFCPPADLSEGLSSPLAKVLEGSNSLVSAHWQNFRKDYPLRWQNCRKDSWSLSTDRNVEGLPSPLVDLLERLDCIVLLSGIIVRRETLFGSVEINLLCLACIFRASGVAKLLERCFSRNHLNNDKKVEREKLGKDWAHDHHMHYKKMLIRLSQLKLVNTLHFLNHSGWAYWNGGSWLESCQKWLPDG